MSAASDSSSEGEEDVMIADVQQAATATVVLITSTSDSERRYFESGNDKKVLYLLCIGLYRPDTNDEKPLFSFEEEPWSSNVPSSSLIRPKNKDYMDEIVRRVKSLNIMPIPRPKNWNRDQQIEWLQQHPVRHERDVEFLINEVLQVEGVLIRKAAEIASVAVGGRGHWRRGNLPYLRMIMCLVQDNVKFLFLICRSNYVSHHVRNSMCNY